MSSKISELSENANNIIIDINNKEQEIICLHFTNVHSNYSMRRIFIELYALGIGTICKIVLKTKLPMIENTHTSEIFVYYDTWNKKLVDLLQMVKSPVEIVKFQDGAHWLVEMVHTNTSHFRTDVYEDKRLIIHSINSAINSYDVNFLFREHGNIEQADFVWVKTPSFLLPTKSQVYVYAKEWSDELFTCKLLQELNEVGVFTIKYNYNGIKDFLWVYELRPVNGTYDLYDFEFGLFRKLIPIDDPKYGERTDKNNKLSWYFTKEGKFAYSDRVADDEIIKHGGVFLGSGSDMELYKIDMDLTSRKKKTDTKANFENVVDDFEVFKELFINALKSVQKMNNEDILELSEDELDVEEGKKLLLQAIEYKKERVHTL